MKNNEVFEANYDFAKTKSAYVFKTIVDAYIGKYSLIKAKRIRFRLLNRKCK